MPDKIGIYDVGDHYEPSESEGEYDDREKRLLKDIRDGRGRRKKAADSEEEVLGFDDDEEEEDDYDDEEDEIRKFEHDSDIEDKEEGDDDLPDRKAWGSKARGFYGADYVDQDYDSLTAQEEERAQLEEIEAKEIQQRLAKELNEADFSLDVFVAEPEDGGKKKKKKKDNGETKLKTDLSGLSERQKRELFRKEAPEFDGLVEDFERNLEECQEVLEPVLGYLKEHGVGDHPFVKFLRTRYDLCLSYCNNISFYLLLKSKKIKVKNHPVVKRMVQMKQLLLELDQKYETSLKAQVDEILEHIASGEELVFEALEEPAKPKKKLAMLRNLEASEEPEDHSQESGSDEDEENQPSSKKLRLDSSDSDEEEEQLPEEDDGPEDADGDGKRKITYQMAKNKGLTAHKRKEQRNIRVKNRRKFQKALVRRKGAIREVKTESTRYAGEASGIKAFVKRSVKLK